jgi:hypothetical protein
MPLQIPPLSSPSPQTPRLVAGFLAGTRCPLPLGALVTVTHHTAGQTPVEASPASASMPLAGIVATLGNLHTPESPIPDTEPLLAI